MTGWADRIASLGATSDLLALLADPDDPQLQAEAERLFFLTLASGWFTAFADPDLPDFVPAPLVRLLSPVEQWLERSPFRVFSAHYMAVLRK